MENDVPGGHAEPAGTARGPTESSLFWELSDAARAAVVAASQPVTLPAGAWLFREGEPARSMYVIRSGRLEVLRERSDRDPEQLVRVLREGSALGELALLTGGPRSASVRAKRDTQLWELDAARFDELLREDPLLAPALTRVLARLLQGERGAVSSPAAPQAAVIALLPLQPGLPSTAVFDGLARSLRGLFGPHGVLQLDAQQAAQRAGLDARSASLQGDERQVDAALGQLLDRCERSADIVLLLADPFEQGEDPTIPPLGPADGAAARWARFCVRQADRVLALISAEHTPDPTSPTVRLVRQLAPGASLDLCFAGTTPTGPAGSVATWRQALPARAHHLLPTAPAPAAAQATDRLARRLTGRSVGVVMSGGGARGFAHIGVLAGLAEAGIVVDRVGGCSFGSFVAALHATGMSPTEMSGLCRRELVEARPLNDYVLPRVSLIQGRKFRALLHRAFGDRLVEELPVDFFAVSANLDTTELMTHREGLVWRAVAASISIPGLVPPFADYGPLLVDGGVLDNLPVDVMSATAEGPIVAVDVMDRRFGDPDFNADSARHRAIRSWRSARARPRTLPYDSPSTRPLPNIMDVISRAAVLGSWRAAEDNRRLAALVVTPDCIGTGTFDWAHLDTLVDAGRRAVEHALERLPDEAGLRARPVTP